MPSKRNPLSNTMDHIFGLPDALFIDRALSAATRASNHCCRFNAYPGPDGPHIMEIDRNLLYLLADELSYDVAVAQEDTCPTPVDEEAIE